MSVCELDIWTCVNSTKEAWTFENSLGCPNHIVQNTPTFYVFISWLHVSFFLAFSFTLCSTVWYTFYTNQRPWEEWKYQGMMSDAQMKGFSKDGQPVENFHEKSWLIMILHFQVISINVHGQDVFAYNQFVVTSVFWHFPFQDTRFITLGGWTSFSSSRMK